MLQGFEAAGTVGIVFEEEAVDMAAAEEDFGNRLVAARGKPCRAEVAAADVHRDRHVRRLCFKRAVDHRHIGALDFFQIKAARLVCLAFLGIAELAPRRVVELEIAAACLVEGANGLLISESDVLEKTRFVLVALDRRIVCRTHAADEMQHARRRDRHLRERIARKRLQIAEMFKERMIAEIHLVHDLHRRRLRLCSLERHGPMLCSDFFDALQGGEKVEMPVATAEFAVRHRLEADFLLLRHEIADRRILGFFQLLRRSFSGCERLTLFLQRFRAQETAHDIVTERRPIFFICHKTSSS